MAIIDISVRDLYKILEFTPARHNIMLIGKHGIGKSQIITGYYEAKGMKVTTLFLGQMSDPGDLIGLPRKDEKCDRTVFMPPYWFPTDSTPIVLFLDELNRARPEILQTVMDLVLNRKLAGKCLPEGSRIISAINDGEEYQLTDLDPALVSRFNIYQFKPTAGEWLMWASKHGIDRHVIDFINMNPDLLDGDGRNPEEISPLAPRPDRRSWERVSDIIKQVDSITTSAKKAVAGIIGIPTANLFFESIAASGKITAEMVLSDFNKHRQGLGRMMPHHITVLNEEIYRCLELGKQGDIKTSSDNLLKYLKWLTDNGKRECMAHFCSIFEGASYAKANLFIMTKAPACLQYINNFIKSL